MYKKPSDECDFRQLKDYQRVVYNSFLTEDPDLFELIKKTHYDIYYVFDRTDLDVNNSIRLNNNVIDNEEDYILKFYTKSFNTLEDVIIFIKEESKNNYFFLISYLNKNLEYGTIPLSYTIRGAEDYRRDRLCDSLINI